MRGGGDRSGAGEGRRDRGAPPGTGTTELHLLEVRGLRHSFPARRGLFGRGGGRGEE